jgi:hypothetical protein
MTRSHKAIIILAKSAFAAAPVAEVARYCNALSENTDADVVRFAFSEQGTPSLAAVLDEVTMEGVAEIAILPLLLPMEPNYRNWIKMSVQRWSVRKKGGGLPQVRIGLSPGDVSDMTVLLTEMYEAAKVQNDILGRPVKVPDASVIPDQQYRVLVCAGGACNDAGAATLWGHLRNAQKDRKLRETSPGMMSCKTTCLGSGPLNLV